ncbi:hypothetical protein P171DRAFT_479351 [Karstenula rhodostoma CBS 690.94]|uniref:Uncharacterized protein n=1 Tax=Karstenula rhodostoma CBS 690.94 TaxID=1392251 RepID=A0A9P4PS01_9PLEO|nr:hypothetical protein P171DRAFT_479351 [Karstenula rhodostoma CBS 690.94]
MATPDNLERQKKEKLKELQEMIDSCGSERLKTVEKWLEARLQVLNSPDADFEGFMDVVGTPVGVTRRLYSLPELEYFYKRISDIMEELERKKNDSDAERQAVLDIPRFFNVRFTKLIPARWQPYEIDHQAHADRLLDKNVEIPASNFAEPSEWILKPISRPYSRFASFDGMERKFDIKISQDQCLFNFKWKRKIKIKAPTGKILDNFRSVQAKMNNAWVEEFVSLREIIQLGITHAASLLTIDNIVCTGIETLHAGRGTCKDPKHLAPIPFDMEIRSSNKPEQREEYLLRYNLVREVCQAIADSKKKTQPIEKLVFHWDMTYTSPFDDDIRRETFEDFVPKPTTEDTTSISERITTANGLEFFESINENSVVIAVKPQFNFREQFADIINVQQTSHPERQCFPAVVICENVDEHGDERYRYNRNTKDPMTPYVDWTFNRLCYGKLELGTSKKGPFGPLTMYIR